MAIPDVRARLSAEGVAEVVAALRTVQREGANVAKGQATGFNALNAIYAKTRNLLGAIGLAVSAQQLVAFGKNALEAADSVGKMGQRVGSTADKMSALWVAAMRADVELPGLEKGLGAVARRVDELRRGVPGAVEDFERLGLSAKDFSGDDTAEWFLTVANAVGRLSDGGRKAAEVGGLIGDRFGRDLIPLFNELNTRSWPELFENARRYGLLLDNETLAATARLADASKDLQIAIQGAATQFAVGFSPAALETMTVLGDRADYAASRFEVLGKVVGGLIRAVAGLVLLAVGQVWHLGESLRVVAEVAAQIWDALIARQFRQALNYSLMFDVWMKQLHARQRAEDAEDLRMALGVSAQSTRTGRGGAGRSWDLPRGAGGNGAADAAAAAREIERAKADILRAEDEIAEAQGRRHAVVMRQIAERAEEIRKASLLLGKSEAEASALAQQYIDAKTAVEDFNQRELEFQRRKAAFDLLAKQLADDRADGLLTEQQYNAAIAALEAERLPRLRELVTELQAAALATRDNALLAKVNEFAASLRTTVVQADESSGRIADVAKSALESFLANGREQFRSFAAFISSAANVLASELQRFGAQQFVSWLFGSAKAAAAPVAKASGGMVYGPGTGTSDSIPAFLSAGEFVVRAAAVERNRALLEAINNGARILRSRPEPVPIDMRRTFANGGIVDVGPGPGAGGRVDLVGGLDLRIHTPPGVTVDWESTENLRGLLRVTHANRRQFNAGLGRP